MNGIDRFLHWSTAIAVLVLLSLGLTMDFVGPGANEALYVRLWYTHVWIGVPFALLLAARVAWRLRHGWPEPLPQPRMLRLLAATTQRTLLTLVVIQALVGLALLLTEGALHRALEDAHALNAWLVIGVLALHAAGGLKHLVCDRARGGGRMFGVRDA